MIKKKKNIDSERFSCILLLISHLPSHLFCTPVPTPALVSLLQLLWYSGPYSRGHTGIYVWMQTPVKQESFSMCDTWNKQHVNQGVCTTYQQIIGTPGYHVPLALCSSGRVCTQAGVVCVFVSKRETQSSRAARSARPKSFLEKILPICGETPRTCGETSNRPALDSPLAAQHRR